MARHSKRRPAGRRGPLATAVLIGTGLLITGGIYAGASAAMAATDEENSSSGQTLTVEDGQKLFEANCATCHGIDLQGSENGPSLYGVGELSVEFQVATDRMPLQAQSQQAPEKPPQFTEEQVRAMAAYVQASSPGPSYPSDEILDGGGDVAVGAELFRINCAMCHNVAGAGGALTEGKYAPPLNDVSALHMYAAMVTGPQNMPVFNNLNLTDEEKRDVISYLLYLQESESPGGFDLGDLGPVSEGLFIWIFGIGGLIAVSIWITAKSN